MRERWTGSIVAPTSARGWLLGSVTLLGLVGCGASDKAKTTTGSGGVGGSAGGETGQSSGGLSAGAAAGAAVGAGAGAANAAGTVNAAAGTTNAGAGRSAGQGGRGGNGGGGRSVGGAGAATMGGGAGVAGASAGAPGGVVHEGDAAACDHSFQNADCWSIYDVSRLHPKGPLLGSAFDGRYVYFVNSGGDANNTGILRYDTQGSFSDDASFSVFNLATVNPATHKFAGAAFDGQYVYFVPFDWDVSTQTSRYDTQGAFDAAASWSTFDLGPMTGEGLDSLGYIGAVFDGRYLYYVPNCLFGYWRGAALRFDTQGTFDSMSDWSLFDTLSLDKSAGGFRGGTFDGRYVYFSPWGDASSGTPIDRPLATRYDTQADFTAQESWATFDLSTLSDTNIYAGAVFDGTYVYLPSGDARGRLTRFESGKAFDSAAGWEVFDMGSAVDGVNDSFNGGVFDGRYLYLVPYSTVPVRYDTTAALDDKSAYETVNLAPLDVNAGNYAGGVFDGRYVYFVPEASNHVVRFDARADAALPPNNNASFY